MLSDLAKLNRFCINRFMPNCACIECRQSAEALGIKLPINTEELSESYRDLAKVWHPDRFQNDERLGKRAEEEFKRIQRAHTHLKEHLASPVSHVSQVDPQTDRDLSSTLSVQYFKDLSDDNRIHLAGVLDRSTKLIIASRFEVEPECLRAFVDTSLTRSFGAGFAFANNRVVVRGLLNNHAVFYRDLNRWKFALRANKTSRDVFDRLAAKLVRDTQDLTLEGVSNSSSNNLSIGAPLTDRKIAAFETLWNRLAEL